MKYSVVNERATPQRVLMTYPFRWMAAAVAAAMGGEKRGYGVAETPTDPQEIIDICTHRDYVIDELQRLRDRFGEDHPAVVALMGLVARDDDGRWTTVHDADTVLDDQVQELLSTISPA